jgi:GntR family transcriptional repressor for pyruvate dehydrogenase complex
MPRHGGQTTGSPTDSASLREFFKPVRTSRVYSEVVSQILKLVDGGQIGPGDRLPPERFLAEQLQVSRSSVREAMTALEVLGVVEIRAGQGIFVGQAQSNHLIEAVSSLTDEQGPLEILEARLLLEPGAAELAAKRASPSDLQMLQAQLELMKEQLDKGMDAWKPDWGFHQAIARAAQNPVVEAMLDVITQRSESELWTRMRKHNFEHRARAFRYLEHHGEILAAIEGRDGPLASRLMRAHIHSIQTDLGVEAAGGLEGG